MTNRLLSPFLFHYCLLICMLCLANRLSAQDNDYARAISLIQNKQYEEAREAFESAAEDSPKAAYEYASALLDGSLGKRDTSLALHYLTDLSCYGHYQGLYIPFLKKEDLIFPEDVPEEETTFQKAAIARIKSFPQNGSRYLSIIYEALGKVYGAEGDFIKAEEYFKKGAQSPKSKEFYCIQDPRLSLALFYLLIDGDYVEYESDSEGGIPFDNLGIVNSSSLRLYKYKETRDENDNTTYWLELFRKDYPEAMSILFTIMGYPLSYILYGIYEFGLPNNAMDHDKAMLIAGEMILSGNSSWLGHDEINKAAHYYYGRGRISQAWEMFRISGNDYGMGRCYYDQHNFEGAMTYLCKALSDYSSLSKEQTVEALSIISSMYRYGRGGVAINERLADKLLEASMKYNVGNANLKLTYTDDFISDVEIGK